MKLKYNSYDDYIKFISSEDALFHFTRKEIVLEHILCNKTLRMGEFSGTNDPQEYKPKLMDTVGFELEEHHDKKLEKVETIIDSLLREKSKFISFCQNDIVDNRLFSHGVLKSRMWAQYGENHKGACIVVSKSKLINQLETKFKSNYHIYCRNIQYEEPNLDRNIPYLDINCSELNSLSASEIAIKFVTQHTKECFFTKQPDYKDEMEFRCVVIPTSFESEPPIYIDLLQCVHSVILGDAFPKVYKPTMLDLAHKLSIPIKKLHWESHDYVLLNWNQS
ncbi:DUF2971 domain-containing protein (plasmid) [Photobacterium damselae subsp. damselae]|uniref:DUF2971 domain-containing protein n=1 Tax=Photobacterium damselae TaxID=38293 RepID=UPI000A300D0B|nr:DUF2971 domain-containing protein [Photobacterium damselae]ARR51888.1 hypothetical protein CAY62_21045 [Photobacterium damselae subsp. damselae]QAY37627.1 DUF2971 domain-containing protein [Photobacterium damselae subsp. damselae]